MKAKKNERVVYFDILNIICMIAVVAMHVNGATHGSPLVRAWKSSFAIDCIFYFAVPVFYMLSGATLYNYREKYDTKTFFKKRLTKIIVPLIYWSIFVYIFKVYLSKDLKPATGILNFINMILGNKIEGTYYFMFDILGIYLTMPLLSLVLKKENNKDLWLVVFLFFVFNGVLPNILPLFNITLYSSLSVQMGGYIVFVILGYLLSTTDIKKNHRIMIYMGTIIGLIYRYVTTYIFSMEKGVVVKTTWGYTSWHSILLACSVFLIVKELSKRLKLSDKKEKILKEVSSCSFGIYLTHMMVITSQIRLLDINRLSWTWRTFGIISTYLITLLAVWILKKIPMFRKVVP